MAQIAKNNQTSTLVVFKTLWTKTAGLDVMMSAPACLKALVLSVTSAAMTSRLFINGTNNMAFLTNLRSAIGRQAPAKASFDAPSGPKTMDFSAGPAKSLTAGLKRVGGRLGISRLGRKGRPFVSHKY